MVHLYKDPEGETVLDLSTQDTHLASKVISEATTADHQNEVTALKQRITELENKLTEVSS